MAQIASLGPAKRALRRVIIKTNSSLRFERWKFPPDKIYNFDKVEVKNSTDLNVLAKCAGISVDELRQYNPELRQHATPSGKSYFLKIPSGLKNEFLNSYNLLDDRQRFAPEYMIHVVKSGRNLSWIADKYGVKIHQIASFKKIKKATVEKINATKTFMLLL